MKNLIALSLLMVVLGSFVKQGNICQIQGVLLDKKTLEPIPFCKITLHKNDSVIATTHSDFDGKFLFNSLEAGIYSTLIESMEYETSKITSISVKAENPTILELKLEAKTSEIEEVTIVSYKIPLIQSDLGASGITISRENISRSPSRSVKYRVGETIGGVNGFTTRGSRSNTFVSNDLDVNSESYSKLSSNQFKKVKSEPLSTFSIDVDKASYSNVRRFINAGTLPPVDAVRIEEMINYFSYDYPKPTNNEPFSITTEYTGCPWNKAHKLVHIGLQGKEIEMENAPSNNLTFLIDVSGSMQSVDKLELLKSGLGLLIEKLRPEDKVSIVAYAGAAGLVLSPTSGSKKDVIIEALNKLTAGGSTAGGQGIELAYKIAKDNFISKGNNRVILATDGDFNVGISSEDELIKLIEEKRADNIYLTVLGFGTGNIQDSKMELLADKGNGNYAYIDNILEAKKVLVKEMGGTLISIANDVKIQAEFNPQFVKAYRLVGYENRILNNEDFNDDKKDAGEIGSGHTVTAIYEIIPFDSKEEISKVDALKYQKDHDPLDISDVQNEVLTIKFRYKNPKETQSNLITKVVSSKETPLLETSNACKFSIAVAEFGMILRNSEFKGTSNYDEILEVAKSAKGNDDEGYRAEFIRLVELAQLIKTNVN